MKGIVCASGVDRLMDFLEGVLPEDLTAALQEHVGGCPRCAAFVASYQAAPRILREATDAALPADVRTALTAALRAETGTFKTERD